MNDFGPDVKHAISEAAMNMNLVVLEQKGFLTKKISPQDSQLYDAIVGNAVVKTGVVLGLVSDWEVLNMAKNNNVSGLQSVIKSILYTVERGSPSLKSQFSSELSKQISEEMKYVKERLDQALEDKTALNVDDLRTVAAIFRQGALKGGVTIEYYGHNIKLNEATLSGLIIPKNMPMIRFNNPPVKLQIDIPRISDIQNEGREVLYS